MIIPLMSACGGDPVLEAAREEEAAQASKSPAGQPGSGLPGVPQPGVGQPGGSGQPGEAGAPSPGVPEEPTPGDPSQPPPGDAGPQSGIRAPEGPTVKIRGTVVFPDYTGGPVRVDLFDGDHSNIGGPRPGIVTRVQMDKPGPFEVSVAQGTKVWISASNDEDDDGRPSPLEPFGDYSRNPLTADEDSSGVQIVLSKREPPKDKK